MTEFKTLKEDIEDLAGSAGASEYYRVLREHGVDQPKRFRTTQSARLCIKDVFEFAEQLRRDSAGNHSGGATVEQRTGAQPVVSVMEGM